MKLLFKHTHVAIISTDRHIAIISADRPFTLSGPSMNKQYQFYEKLVGKAAKCCL